MSSSFPVIRATMNMDVYPWTAQDVNTIWTSQIATVVGTLSAAVAATDTTFVLKAAPVQNLVGSTVLIDQDPCAITAVASDGVTFTIQRYTTAFPFMSLLVSPPSEAHAANTAVNLLNYATPWIMLGEKYVRPQLQSDIAALGKLALSFGLNLSGTMTLLPAGST